VQTKFSYGWKKSNKNKAVAGYLPDGKALQAKLVPSKNSYKFLDAIALNFVLFADDAEALLLEMNPETTEDLISRWEKEYGIPDQCLGIAPDLETRRKNILIKIGMNGVVSIQDFIDLAAKFGYIGNIRIRAGFDACKFPLEFPWIFASPKIAKFLLVVDLPKELGLCVFPFEVTKFPFPFCSENDNIIECVFNRLVPANVKVIFRYIL